jgi:hypothetical protein
VGNTTIRMAGGATCIDNASDTSSTALYSIDPQTRDYIYDKTNTNSTIQYVNTQIT